MANGKSNGVTGAILRWIPAVIAVLTLVYTVGLVRAEVASNKAAIGEISTDYVPKEQIRLQNDFIKESLDDIKTELRYIRRELKEK